MIASSVIMIRPTAFGYNSETALSNSFQHSPMLTSTQVQLAALKEFEKLHEELVKNGIEVILFNDTLTPVKPDAVFPNNWFSTHIDGTIFLYPMLSIARRKERREDVIERLRENFSVKKIVDLSKLETEGKFLEGTGSMVFDHKSKIIYAGLSPRTNYDVLKVVADELKYELTIFRAADKNGKDIYHTNVAMSVSDDLALICLDCINENRILVKQKLLDTGKVVVEISVEQMENFCGNMLMLKNKEGKNLMVMSERASNALREEQILAINRFAKVVCSPIPTIENIGGGSARCMLVENFLESIN